MEDITALEVENTPIMLLPVVFQGDVDGTKKGYVSRLGMESLSGYPSSVTTWRRSLRVRWVGRAGEDWGERPLVSPLGFGDGKVGHVSCCDSALAPTCSV